MRTGAFFTILFLVLAGCKNPETKNAHPLYFDLAGYFKAEAKRLGDKHQEVKKSVDQNGQVQARKVKNLDWEVEFELFSQSDINKPSWRGYYNVTNSGAFLIYTAKNPDLRTRRILIKKEQNRVRYILISNAVKNALYNSVERLTYYPDSLYRIEKKQQVRIIGRNSYRIEGHIQ
ncbi:MAG: hypothetical protein INR69_01950 [Mucilaginibacter polytrichastri]|nr:hypothetical protein [Mucilaginibacter polytrichastri]